MVGVAIGMIVAADDAGKGFADYFSEDINASAGRNEEDHCAGSDKAPEIAPATLVLPAGFVDIEQGRGVNITLDGTEDLVEKGESVLSNDSFAVEGYRVHEDLCNRIFT